MPFDFVIVNVDVYNKYNSFLLNYYKNVKTINNVEILVKN